jgi:protein-tyrosine-phosphatase
MAMIIFRDMVKALGEEWRVDSAGTWSIEGAEMAERSRTTLEEKGHDPGDHRSKSVSQSLLAEYDLILTMERGHKEALRIEFPEFAKRIYLLSEMIGSRYDIPDPIGKSKQDFEDTYLELEEILKTGFDRIQRLTAQKSN